MNAMRCPFCNSLDLVMDCSPSSYWVRCLDCGACGPHTLNTRERAIEMWNGTYPHQNPSALICKRDANQRMSKEIE